MKRRKFTNVEHYTCCSCLEENVPYLLLIGCSRQHTMCHLCMRLFVSSKLEMSAFPYAFPGKIRTRGELKCPLCQEQLHGLSNMFVYQDLPDKYDYECPYRGLLADSTAGRVGCRDLRSLPALQTHLIEAHTHTVKCPHCSEWLCDPQYTTTEEVLTMHMLEDCARWQCQGCQRQGNMWNMYLHSTMGREGVCLTPYELFQQFGQGLGDCHALFEGPEDLGQIAHMMLRWVFDYIRMRQYPIHATTATAAAPRTASLRLFSVFVVQVYARVHSRVRHDYTFQAMVHALQQRAHNRSQYMEFLVLNSTCFAHKHALRVDKLSQLPFFYRLVTMAMSKYQNGAEFLRRYPRNITLADQTEVTRLVDVYQQLIPPPPPPTVPPGLLLTPPPPGSPATGSSLGSAHEASPAE